MQSKAATVDAYLAELPAEASKALSRLRALIRKAAPGLQETMAHGMAAYLRDGEMLFALAAQKQNLAFYCCDTGALARHVKQLTATSAGKSCVRFKTLAQLDLAAVETLIRDVASR